MGLEFKQLGQLRPANTNAASLFSPATGEKAIVLQIVVTNVDTASSHDFRIFLDTDGTTYDETTAHFWDEALAADTAIVIDCKWGMNDATGNLAVRSDAANDLNFTAYGVIIT